MAWSSMSIVVAARWLINYKIVGERSPRFNTTHCDAQSPIIFLGALLPEAVPMNCQLFCWQAVHQSHLQPVITLDANFWTRKHTIDALHPDWAAAIRIDPKVVGFQEVLDRLCGRCATQTQQNCHCHPDVYLRHVIFVYFWNCVKPSWLIPQPEPLQRVRLWMSTKPKWPATASVFANMPEIDSSLDQFHI